MAIFQPCSEAADPLVFVTAFAAGDEGAVHAFQFDPDSGALRLLQKTTDVEFPFFIALSPNQKFLYAIDTEEFSGDKEEFITAFAIEGRTGRLTKLNRQPSRGKATCYLEVDSTGKSVLAAHYTSGSVVILPALDDGSLGEATTLIEHRRSTVEERAGGAEPTSEPKAHCIVASPDNRLALAADLGIDQVLTYRLDPEAARLVPHPTFPRVNLPPGSGPRHLSFHPNGRWVYVINELANTMTHFVFDAESGELRPRQTIATLPSDFTGVSHTADVKVSPNGKYLYGTNRGHDTIAVYRIGDEGNLSLLDFTPSRGDGPQNLLISPDGRWLFCANMPGNNLAVFKIDENSGRIQAVGEPLSIPQPSCLRWLR